MADPIRLLIVDDDHEIRQSLADLVAREPTLRLAAALPDGGAALEAVEAGLAFDVGLIDLAMPGLGGLETIARLRARSPDATLVAFTIFDDGPTVMAALRAGARGYLVKSVSFPRLLSSLREAREGGAPMTPRIARLVVDALAAPAPADDEGGRRLSPREQQVLGLLARGVTYAETAAALGIGLGTLQGYVKNLYRKLEVASKAEAAAIAVKRGLA